MTKKQVQPQVYSLLPLRDIIVFPHMVVPLFVGREKSIRALEDSMTQRKQIVLAAQKKAQNNNPQEKDIFDFGTLANIIQLLRLPDGTLKVLVEGVQRVKITGFVDTNSIFRVEAEPIDEMVSSMVEAEALTRGIKGTFETYVKLNKRIPPELVMSVLGIEEPGKLADTIVPHLNIKVEEKQADKTTTLEQATNDIAKKLVQQDKAPAILQQKADAILAELKASKNIDASLKLLGAKWESTGSVAPGAQSLPKVGGDASLVDGAMRLAKVGDVADKVFDVTGSKVILKLKSKTEPDASKLDEKKQADLAQTAASSAGYALMTSYERSLRKELEEKGKIWENPEYLSLGQSRGEGADQGAGG
jgi:Lon protease-like protein